MRIRLLIYIVLMQYPLFSMSQSKFPACKEINWATWSSIGGKNAIGTITNQEADLSILMTSTFEFESVPQIGRFEEFKRFKGKVLNTTVPRTSWSKVPGGTINVCFSQPVKDPVLLLASLGDYKDRKETTISFSASYVIVYNAGGIKVDNSTTITGREGYGLLKFPGEIKCITITSSTDESFSDITWGVSVCPDDAVKTPPPLIAAIPAETPKPLPALAAAKPVLVAKPEAEIPKPVPEVAAAKPAPPLTPVLEMPKPVPAVAAAKPVPVPKPQAEIPKPVPEVAIAKPAPPPTPVLEVPKPVPAVAVAKPVPSPKPVAELPKPAPEVVVAKTAPPSKPVLEVAKPVPVPKPVAELPKPAPPAKPVLDVLKPVPAVAAVKPVPKPVAEMPKPMAKIPAGANTVASANGKSLKIRIWDHDGMDYDSVSLKLNGKQVGPASIQLPLYKMYGSPEHTYQLELKPGDNTLEIYAISEGLRPSITIGIQLMYEDKPKKLFFTLKAKETTVIHL